MDFFEKKNFNDIKNKGRSRLRRLKRLKRRRRQRRDIDFKVPDLSKQYEDKMRQRKNAQAAEQKNKEREKRRQLQQKEFQRKLDIIQIHSTYRYKKDFKYLVKHLQQWKGEPYEFVEKYYKSPDWPYYKAANKHNELIRVINARSFPIKSGSNIERGIATAKEIAIFFIKVFVAIYLGCFLIWNSFHSVESKDLDLDDETHPFSVEKFMNMIDIYEDQSPNVYMFIKSLYIGLAKIPRDALYYVFCQKNKILESLYYGKEGGALWQSKTVYGRTPSQVRSIIQLLLAAVLPVAMYLVGTMFASIFMFGYLHLGYVKSTINIINNDFFLDKDSFFFKYNYLIIFLWFTIGALVHFILVPAVIGFFFTVGYIVKMLQNISKVNNVFKNITKSYLNLVLFMFVFGILLIQKYNLYFHEKLPINVNSKGMLIVSVALPFILIPLYFMYNAFFGPKVSSPAAATAPTS